MSKLEDILQQEISTEMAAIQGESEAKAKAIVDAAMQRAEAQKASKQTALEAERSAAIRRAESAAELVMSQARIAARGQAVDKVKIGVQEALSGHVNAQVLTKLADEALAGLGKAETVVVNPAQASLLEGWAKTNGLKLETNPAVQMGVRVIAEGGRSMIQNTLPERLERAWDALSAKAAKAIWG